ncbi:MAG: aldehyde reductase [Hyphomicrobiaceae bacterium]|nr:aldehyde reductase [Hyphomicrobiaceae bacterium]MCC0023749.1 aldehyde reductase [Hyphomicrobiaceae bacterium]
MSETVLVTGISGFVGGHVALQLLNKGYRVRGSLRSLNRADKVRKTLENAGADISNLEFVALDLMKDEGWDEAMQGVSYLQHVASPFVTVMPKDRNELVRPAVEGTTRALRAALNADVKRIVVTSSFAAIGYGWGGTKAHFTADDWTKLGQEDVNAYIESKTRAEQAAWDLMREAGREADLATINPGMIVGPLLDEDPGTSASLVVDALKGRFPAVPNIAMVFIDVRDVAAMHVAAMENADAGGKRHPATTGTYSLLEMGQMIGRAVPERASRMPKFTVPDWIIRIVAPFVPDIRSNIAELGSHRTLDEKPLRDLIGRNAIPAAEAVGATAKSVMEQGLA